MVDQDFKEKLWGLNVEQQIRIKKNCGVYHIMFKFYEKKKWILTNGRLGLMKKNHGVSMRNSRLE